MCLAENAGSARKIEYPELADTWPNHEWWLAVNPGLPIEGYLPPWFVDSAGPRRRPAARPDRRAGAGQPAQRRPPPPRALPEPTAEKVARAAHRDIGDRGRRGRRAAVARRRARRAAGVAHARTAGRIGARAAVTRRSSTRRSSSRRCSVRPRWKRPWSARPSSTRRSSTAEAIDATVVRDARREASVRAAPWPPRRAPGRPRPRRPAEPPKPAPFAPANEVEENLLDAAVSGKTNNFLSTLLLAKVLIPIPTGESADVKPDNPAFPWRREVVDGQQYLVVFTSAAADDRVHGRRWSTTVTAKFLQLIRNWPDVDWSFAVNPGSPVGATLPGAQIKALVGVGRRRRSHRRRVRAGVGRTRRATAGGSDHRS